MSNTRKLVAELLAYAGRRYPFHRGRTKIRRMMDQLLPQGDYRLLAKMRHRGAVIACPRSDVMSLDLFTFGDYEEDVVQMLMHAVNLSGISNPVLVDVGANLGTMSLPLAKMLGCHTVSIEPQPTLAALLRENAKSNGVNHLVRVVDQAVGASKGVITFYINPAHLATASRGEIPIGDRIEVEIERLDALVTPDEWERTAILKVDVEGFERDVFLGASGLLQKRQPPIIFEVNTPSLEALQQTPAQVVDPLKEFGYTKFLAFDEVLYPPGNGVNMPANIVALTDAHATFMEKCGYNASFTPKRKKMVRFDQLTF